MRSPSERRAGGTALGQADNCLGNPSRPDPSARGSLGLRDEGLLESALEARNRWHYEPEADLTRITAAYGYGLARNHAFVDGNKGVAFQVMYVFLGLNGYRIEAAEPDVVELMLGVAEGRVEEESLANWLHDHIQPRSV